jgi:predicted Zn-dependent protease with MMP-like domain
LQLASRASLDGGRLSQLLSVREKRINPERLLASHMIHRRPLLSVTEPEFQELVQQALDGLPDEYAKLISNVAVVVEDEPSPDLLADLEMEEDEDLLGLYQGLPIDHESFFQTGGQLPARISIYRGPILRICRTKKEVVQEVRDTVVHEIGHHFGLDDDEMPY